MSVLQELGIRLIWFDSMGAKSSCVAVETAEGPVVIDPGASKMQPSYPLPSEEKLRLKSRALGEIYGWLRRARAVVITHYHYDHHLVPGEEGAPPDPAPYRGKLIIAKDPNAYINESQWKRARDLFSSILEASGDRLEGHLTEPLREDFPDPVENLPLASSADFGDYAPRRRELLAKGRKWFQKLARGLWSSEPWVEEFELGDGTRVVWGDGRTFEIGGVRFEILGPWFHGLEYDRTGWVTPVVVRRGGRVAFITSDVMGPEIEDYAEAVASARPDAVILDGPPTYLFPFMLNRINLERAVENAIRIVEAEPELIVYDHHLLRERRWRERVRRVFAAAEREGVTLTTAAEVRGDRPLIDTL